MSAEVPSTHISFSEVMRQQTSSSTLHYYNSWLCCVTWQGNMKHTEGERQSTRVRSSLNLYIFRHHTVCSCIKVIIWNWEKAAGSHLNVPFIECMCVWRELVLITNAQQSIFQFRNVRDTCSVGLSIWCCFCTCRLNLISCFCHFQETSSEAAWKA